MLKALMYTCLTYFKMSQIGVSVFLSDSVEVIIKQKASAVQLSNLSTSPARSCHQRHSEQGKCIHIRTRLLMLMYTTHALYISSK